MILHCMRKKDWEEIKDNTEWGSRNIKDDGFIRCSSPELFWRVAPPISGKLRTSLCCFA